MSTQADFENAPGGATATNEYGMRAMKLNQWGRWASQTGGIWDSGDMERYRYTLDPSPAPTTAREALDLAWELAHPVKEGQRVESGTQCIAKVRDGEFATYRATFPFTGASGQGRAEARTLDPLPDPEPDWAEAPAVIAWSRWDDVRREKVWSKADECYKSTDGEIANWSDLCYVTPLYPKEGQEA